MSYSVDKPRDPFLTSFADVSAALDFGASLTRPEGP